MVERELCTPKFVITNFSVEVPCVGSHVWMYSENPSVRRRGRRAMARTSKHIPVFVFDPLNSISLISCITYIIHISYMLGIICVPILVLYQESFI